MKQLTLIDWKSSKDVWLEYKIQVTAYQRAYNLDALKKNQPTIERLGVLRLDKETGMPDYKDVTEGADERWRAFCGILEYYHCMIEPTATDGIKARFYKREGLQGPSVTTVLSALSKPALIQWAANCASEFIGRSMEEIRRPETTQDRIDQLLKKAKTAHWSEAKKAMDVGTIVHDAIETYLRGGRPEEILSGCKQAETAFLAFLEWKDKVELEPVALEVPVFHPILLYGGTPDFIGYLKPQEGT